MKTPRKEPVWDLTNATIWGMNLIILLWGSAVGTVCFFVLGEFLNILFVGGTILTYLIFLVVLPAAENWLEPGRVRVERKGAWRMAVIGYGGVLLTMVLRTLYIVLGG